MHGNEITLRDMAKIHQYPATAKREPCAYFMRFTHQKPSHNDANYVPMTTKLASCVMIISGATRDDNVGGLVGDVIYFLVVHPSLYTVLWFIDGDHYVYSRPRIENRVVMSPLVHTSCERNSVFNKGVDGCWKSVTGAGSLPIKL